ncbi:MAG TPA: Gfo/Idh/MocA family oxidoreductase [Alphaproteobacteria bacterium]|nr:Gfo/Idh/MocA family oxidoreductase [Alphaproteobacteria bacterium]
MIRVAIIGCGLVGQKRARALAGAKLVACVDPDQSRAGDLAQNAKGCAVFPDWRSVIRSDQIDVVIVATPHNLLAEISGAAVREGKHVLVEKPGARNVDELRGLISIAESAGVRVRVGFNHRYHPAFQQARELVDSGKIGSLMFIRARYGHGGRKEYDREWRARPEISGGGELIDQGTHLIDLAHWFLGEFEEVDGFAHTYFWEIPVDDNAFLLLKTKEKKVAFLHASWTEWKNTFSFEIYGRGGKLQVDGLGGSYGAERLTWYRMLPEMGPPETNVWEYPMEDDSWEVEMAEFLKDIRLSRASEPGLHDAFATLKVVEQIYQGGPS